MGLDMYLKGNLYLGRFDHMKESRSDEFDRATKVLEVVGALPFIEDNASSLGVDFTLGYWRKANAVHRFFVERVQEGVDDCGTYDVDDMTLVELRALAAHILDVAVIEPGKVRNGYKLGPGGERIDIIEDGLTVTNADEIRKLLPPQSGFFFGSTDIDQWYIEHMKLTVEICDRALAFLEVHPKAWITYTSSW